MPRLSKKQKQEWQFFIGENGRRQYNELCKRCKHSCKQSFRVKIIECPSFTSKRQKK